MKKLILVTSPPACGKTFVSREIAKALNNIVYLDKDTVIPLSKQVFKVANVEYNRSSDFFEEHIRDYEYEVTINFALEALEYNDTVLINAPFTREVRDEFYITSLKDMLQKKNAKLDIVWVETDKEVCHERMIERNSSRDTWKLNNWDEYIAGCNFTRPNIEDLIIFKNSSTEEFNESIHHIVELLG